jgi:hypothetical protein
MASVSFVLRTIGEQLELEWRYKEKAAAEQMRRDSSAPGRDDSFKLSPELAAELRHLAMQGDVLAITARIDAILVTDSSARDFCGQMQELAARFDIRGIRQALAARSGESSQAGPAP